MKIRVFFNDRSQMVINNLTKTRVATGTGEAAARTDDYINKIGRWGELWVNEYLKKKFEVDIAAKKVVLKWMNEEREQGLPYDFRVSRVDEELMTAEGEELQTEPSLDEFIEGNLF